MYLSTEKKVELFKMHGKSVTDTGSSESQIALFTYRITYLTEHLQSRKGDHGSRQGLLRLVGKRRRLLDYIQKNDIERYRAIIAKLGIRK